MTMTIPNVLTLIRIFLTPYLVWLLLDNRLNHALLVFFLAGITDGLDGLIARAFQQKSKLGAYLDPLADKLLLVSSFILLGYLGLVPNWLVIVAVSRDAMILLGLITLCFFQVQVQISPSVVSKITTLLQLFTVLFVLSSSVVNWPPWSFVPLFGTTAALTVASGVHYLLIGLSLLEGRRHGRS
ncbi:MAG: CDP-alcohol phosphatidyltransferase family protein [Deltaproteobacteria bacterium]|nr:CDP-alcohol phosphatidyltransferase family protein [Deltaproteobacteria bacterium]